MATVVRRDADHTGHRPLKDERALFGELLYEPVAVVGHVHEPLGVSGDRDGLVEIAGPLAEVAPLVEVDAFRRERLDAIVPGVGDIDEIAVGTDCDAAGTVEVTR